MILLQTFPGEKKKMESEWYLMWENMEIEFSYKIMVRVPVPAISLL